MTEFMSVELSLASLLLVTNLSALGGILFVLAPNTQETEGEANDFLKLFLAVVYRLTLHPLAKYPDPFVARVTD